MSRRLRPIAFAAVLIVAGCGSVLSDLPASTLTASTTAPVGDGVTPVTLAAAIFDTEGEPVRGLSVSWFSDAYLQCRFTNGVTVTDANGIAHNDLVCTGAVTVAVFTDALGRGRLTLSLTFSDPHPLFWVPAIGIAPGDRIGQVVADSSPLGGAWAFGTTATGFPVLYRSGGSGLWSVVASGAELPAGITAIAITPAGVLYSIGATVQSSYDGVAWGSAATGLPAAVAQVVTANGVDLFATAPSGDPEVYVSHDAGATWVTTGAAPFQFEPRNPRVALSIDGRTLYARQVTHAGAYGWEHLAVSSDGGKTWTDPVVKAPGFPGYPTAMLALVSSTTDAATEYAFAAMHIYTLLCGGTALYVTQDRGATWNGADAPAGSVAAADPRDGNTVYVAQPSHCADPDYTRPVPPALWRTSDGGQTWAAVGGGLQSHLVVSLAIDAQTRGVVYGVLDNGDLYMTTTGGT